MSNFFIRDKFSEFDFDFNAIGVKEQKSHPSNKISYLGMTNEYSKELIGEIDDENCKLLDQEIKYKIFEDISSVSKKNNMIELVLDIPVDNSIISINKIKLSNKLNKYIRDIYVCVGNEKIITHKDFTDQNQNQNQNQESSTKFTKHISSQKTINCQCSKNITLHILLANNVINKIINKNIFVNYSFVIFKPKLKFNYILK